MADGGRRRRRVVPEHLTSWLQSSSGRQMRSGVSNVQLRVQQTPCDGLQLTPFTSLQSFATQHLSWHVSYARVQAPSSVSR